MLRDPWGYLDRPLRVTKCAHSATLRHFDTKVHGQAKTGHFIPCERRLRNMEISENQELTFGAHFGYRDYDRPYRHFSVTLPGFSLTFSKMSWNLAFIGPEAGIVRGGDPDQRSGSDRREWWVWGTGRPSLVTTHSSPVPGLPGPASLSLTSPRAASWVPGITPPPTHPGPIPTLYPPCCTPLMPRCWYTVHGGKQSFLGHRRRTWGYQNTPRFQGPRLVYGPRVV